jgi:hypothetical protein
MASVSSQSTQPHIRSIDGLAIRYAENEPTHWMPPK